jgi:hypothetical protein
MNPGMMRAWLAEQAKKATVSPSEIQRKRLGIHEGFFTATQPKQQLKQPLPSQTSTPEPAIKINTGGSLGAGTAMPAVGDKTLIGIGGPDVIGLQKYIFAKSTKVTQHDQHWDPKTRRTVHTQRELTPQEIHARGFDDPDKRGFTSLFKGMQLGAIKQLSRFGKPGWMDPWDFTKTRQWNEGGWGQKPGKPHPLGTP